MHLVPFNRMAFSLCSPRGHGRVCLGKVRPTSCVFAPLPFGVIKAAGRSLLGATVNSSLIEGKIPKVLKEAAADSLLKKNQPWTQ